MRLDLAHIKVEDVVFGAGTVLKDRILTIDRETLLAAMDPEDFFVEKRVTLAKPGQSARIIRIMDAMQPRCKVSGGTSPYPGAIGDMHMAGQGRTHMLDGVCVTGGEPLLRPGLEALLEEIKALGFPIKLDTNGSHPQLLARLWSLGLVDYAAMDIKNSPERYGETAGVPGLDLGPIRESVSWLLEGHVDYEFRTTVVRQFHDSASFRAIGPWISGARRYFLQAFIDRDTVLRPGLSAWSREEMEGFAALVRPWVPAVELRGI